MLPAVRDDLVPDSAIVRARSIAVLGAGALVPLSLIATACGDDGPGDAARFCRDVEENLPALTTSPATLDDVDGFLDRYRSIGDAAPLEIEPHWDALIENYETASTVEPHDPESLQRARAMAFATEKSAVAVRDFLLTECALDMGPITTIVPHAPTGAEQPPATSPATTAPPG